mgnify:CR=1 FL=1
MNLIRQIVNEKIKCFNEEKDKGYLDIWSFYQAYSLISVIMNKEFDYQIDENKINIINSLWKHLNITVVNKAYSGSISIKEINSKTLSYFEEMINKDFELINLFMHKTEKEEIKDKIIIKKYGRGVIGEVINIHQLKYGS